MASLLNEAFPRLKSVLLHLSLPSPPTAKTQLQKAVRRTNTVVEGVVLPRHENIHAPTHGRKKTK